MTTAPRLAQSSTTPERLGDYAILSPISAGGMGIVYRARHVTSDAIVAVKTVHLESESLLSGIRREIRSLRSLEHPGVVRILEDGTDGGVPFYAMELLDGPTLRQFHRARAFTPSTAGSRELDRYGWMPPVRVADLEAPTRALEEVDVADGEEAPEPRGEPISADPKRLQLALSTILTILKTLAFVHGRGVVHRDLKPDNIILMPRRGPVIVDFGISIQSLSATAREALESGGRAMGSPGYMAPEQIRGDIVDARADLYAIGCMLFEIVTGRLPFEAQALKLLFSKKLHADAPSPRAFIASIPVELDRLIVRLLARRPEQRPGHADDVAAALAAMGADDHGQPGPPVDPYLYRPQLAGRDNAVQALAAVLSRATVGIAAAARKVPPSGVERSGASSEVRRSRAALLDPIGIASEELATRLDATIDVVGGTAVGSSRGCFAFVGGESGVGKTRLAVEIATHAQRRGFSVVTCQCVRVDTEADVRALGVRAAPLHPFSDFFLAVADRCRALGETGYEELLGAGGSLLASYQPVLALLPGFKREPRSEDLPPEAAREQVHEALRHTMRAFAAREPLLLVIDDLQWADEHTLHFLRSLDTAWFDKNPIVILPTYRVEEDTRELADLRQLRADTSVVLERLHEDAMIRIVRDMLAVDTPDPRLIAFLQTHSEGNPFFIAEFLRAAITKRLLRRDGSGSWQYEVDDTHEHIDSLPLPAALRDIIAFRLAGLSAEARAVAEMLAVLGREAQGSVLDRAQRRTRLLEGDAVNELVLRNVVEEHEPGTIRFVHDKIREIAYASIDEGRRAGLHRSAGEALAAWAEPLGEAERLSAELAHHFAEAKLVEKACDYFEKAGERAMAEGTYSDAVRFFERAADLWPSAPHSAEAEGQASLVRRAGWVRKAAMGYHALGDLFSAEKKGREAMRLATGGTTLLDLQLQGSSVEKAIYVSKAVVEVGVQLSGLFDRLGARKDGSRTALHREAALTAEKLAETYMFLNDQTRAAIATVLAGNHAQRLGASPELARACSQLAIAASYVPAHRLGKVYADRAQKIARLLRDRRTDLDIDFMRGFWSTGCNDGREARACLTSSLRLSRELMDRRREEESLALLGMLEAMHGLHGESLDRYAELEELALRSQNEQARFWAYAGRAQVWVRLGRANATIEDYDRLRPYIERAGDTAERIQLVVPGPVYARKGMLAEAKSALHDFLRLTENKAPAGCMLFWSYEAACDTAFLLVKRVPASERAEMKRLAELTVRVIEQFATIFPIGRCEAQRARARALEVVGKTRAAEKLLGAAIESARSFDLPVETGKAHADMARISTDSRKRSEHAKAARDIFTRVGTWGLIEEIDEAS